ncbi:MAG TPA: von Willebrand factor type A domain-containing protein [Phnomibacter sp.]|nr:von Willebrand factor type A domain-containing protein [Phnomibacter sp.]
MTRRLFIVCLAFLYCFLSAATVAGQQYYFTGSFVDSLNRPIPYVQIKLKGNALVYQAGSGGEFGILSFNRSDSAACYVVGFDTIRLIISHGKFEKIVLPYTASLLRREKQESKLSNLVKQSNIVVEETIASSGSGESYNEMVENELIDAGKFPAIGVMPNNNHASYSNVRRLITHHSIVPSNAVRIEELWNYFDLKLPGMQASDSVFKVTYAMSPCPWNENNQLLMLNAVAPKFHIDSLPACNLVFLIDNSGSMEDHNRLPLLKSGFKKLVEILRPIDKVSIVTYGGAPGIMLAPTFGNEKEKITAAIDELVAGGATQGSNGIHLAYQLATTNPIEGGVNKVILATDGDFNIGIIDEDALERLVRAYQSTGVTLSCLGVGMGNYKDSKIEVLAKMGDGSFAYLDTEEEAQKVLVEELTEDLYHVATNAQIQMYFDSSVVQQYKLIGYNNRKQALAKNSQQLNGGSIGTGQAIVAMFELQTKPGISLDGKTLGYWNLQYRKVQADSALINLETPIIAVPKTIAAADSAFRKAAALAWYGKILRSTTAKHPIPFDKAATLAATAFNAQQKQEQGFLQLLTDTQRLYENMQPAKSPGNKRKPLPNWLIKQKAGN